MFFFQHSRRLYEEHKVSLDKFFAVSGADTVVWDFDNKLVFEKMDKFIERLGDIKVIDLKTAKLILILMNQAS